MVCAAYQKSPGIIVDAHNSCCATAAVDYKSTRYILCLTKPLRSWLAE